MRKSLKQLPPAVASAAGYIATPEVWAERLSTLQGEFRGSPSELLYQTGRAALLVACGGLVMGLAIREYIINHPDAQFYLFSALAAFLFFGAIYLLTRTGIWYNFENGSLVAFRTDGRAIWTESLSGLSYVTRTAGYGVMYMTLRWKDRKRRLEVYESLRRALNASASNDVRAG